MSDKPKIEDGGPAFPQPSYLDAEDGSGTRSIIMASDGMTLRDYFAAKAMQAMLSDARVKSMRIALVKQQILDRDEQDGLIIAQVAKLSFMMASAMLSERPTQCS